VLAEAGTGPGDGWSGQLSMSSRREHGEVVEGAGGEGDEHRRVKAKVGKAAPGSGGGRRRLTPMGPQWQRAT
jgi:hypothetical protein